MKVGTKSLLFGVHQFLWHPWTVARAWRFIHRRWPRGWEWLAILVHDWGYWGCADIDGKEGKNHPVWSALLAERVMTFFKVPQKRITEIYELILLHSQTTSNRVGMRPSALCWPDKYSIVYDPPWWYLFRARLSGELAEYRKNAVDAGQVAAFESDRSWYHWLAARNIEKTIHNALRK